MFLKPPKPSTDPKLRSLLQKAARRGFPTVVQGAVGRLVEVGDRTWLRSRAVVITFEECWPLAANLELSRETETKLRAIVSVTKAQKQKDAAGLGALAYAFHEGDESMCDLVPNFRSVRIVSEALDRPNDFFLWAESRCATVVGARIIDSAKRYLAAATWGWDKTCILAGAFLAATEGIPACEAGPEHRSDFPYWVALDKHTPEGKELLQRLCAEMNVQYRQAIWSAFYFEGARVNALLKSDWWTAEMTWRLRKTGLTVSDGAALWERMRPQFSARMAVPASELRQKVQGGATAIQDRLF